MPTVVVGIGSEPREPLCDLIQRAAVIKGLVATSPRNMVGNDGAGPVDLKHNRAAWFQRRRQVNAHHGSVDNVRQVAAAAVGDAFEGDAALKLLSAEVVPKGVVAHAVIQVGGSLGELPSCIRAKSVLIKLEPKPVQRVGAVVVIRD